jgi:acetolactate synthase-1/2/3 large subunit
VTLPRFDDCLTGGIQTFASEAEIIHIDFDRSEMSKNVKADYLLVGDAKSVIKQLATAMPK